MSSRFSDIARQYNANQFQSEIANLIKYLRLHLVDECDAGELLCSYATPLTILVNVWCPVPQKKRKAFANFHGRYISTRTHFKLLTWWHWTWSWEDGLTTGSCEQVWASIGWLQHMKATLPPRTGCRKEPTHWQQWDTDLNSDYGSFQMLCLRIVN